MRKLPALTLGLSLLVGGEGIAQGLEAKVNKPKLTTKRAIAEDFISHPLSFAHDAKYNVTYNSIVDILEQSKNIDLSKNYPSESHEYKLQRELESNAWSMMWLTEHYIEKFGKISQKDVVALSLNILQRVKEKFGLHPFRDDVYRTQLKILGLPLKEGTMQGPYEIPQRFQALMPYAIPPPVLK